MPRRWLRKEKRKRRRGRRKVPRRRGGTLRRYNKKEIPEKRPSKPKKPDSGLVAEWAVTAALKILERNVDSRVAGFEHASQLSPSFDSQGIDFVIFLRIKPPDSTLTLRERNRQFFCLLPLQVKKSSGYRKEGRARKNRRGQSVRNRNLHEHYFKHPLVLAIAVNDRSPQTLAIHIENLIERLLGGKRVPAPNQFP